MAAEAGRETLVLHLAVEEEVAEEQAPSVLVRQTRLEPMVAIPIYRVQHKVVQSVAVAERAATTATQATPQSMAEAEGLVERLARRMD